MVLHLTSVMTFVALAAVVAMATMVVSANRYRGSDAATWLIVSAVVTTLWSITVLGGLFTDSLYIWGWLDAILWICLSITAVTWLAFVLVYTGRRHLTTGWALFVIGLPSAVTVGIVGAERVTDVALLRDDIDLVEVGHHTLLSGDLGAWGLVQAGYAFLLLGTATVLLVEQLLGSHEVYRRQAAVLAGATVVPTVMAMLGLVEMLPGDGAVLAVFAFPVTAIAMVAAIERLDVLRTTPVPLYLAHSVILQSLDTPITVLNDDDVVVHANPVAEAVFTDGCTLRGERADALPGVSVADEELVVASGMIEVTGPDGNHSYYTRTTPLEDDRGRRHGSVVWYQDVTGVRRREQRLNVLNRVLRHDIRNEMNLVMGQAQTALEGLREPEPVLGSIVSTAESVVTLSETARDIEHLITRAPSLESAGTLDDAIESVHTRIVRDHPGASLATEVDIAGSTAVPVGFEEVIWQLVDNGIRHNASSEPAVQIGIDHTGTGLLRCRVTDDGPGIPSSELEVFDAGEETALDHASGLGLWLVHWVVHGYGGEVHVDSGADGTAVTVTLPPANSS